MMKQRFAVLLGALTILVFVIPIVRVFGSMLHPQISRLLVNLSLITVLISALLAVSNTKKTLTIGLWIAIPAIVLSLTRMYLEQDLLNIASHGMSIVFFTYTIVLILKMIMEIDRVTFDTLCAALCVYIMIGLTWALVYSLMEILNPGSFAFPVAREGEIQFMRMAGEHAIIPVYYSFVTMTTLGYGDIVPISAPTRMAAALEALIGQLYLAILVARLVGVHITQTLED